MFTKKIALIALASTAFAVPAYASNDEIDMLMKEINKLKSQVNALQKKSAEAVPSAAPAQKPVVACEAQGDGFFVIPGTTTCMRLSGYARTGGTYTELLGAEKASGENTTSSLSFEGRFRLNTDVRASTDMGTLRGFARLHLDASSSAFNLNASTPAFNSFSTSADLAQAYVSLGGWSMGRQDSAFLFFNRVDASFIPTDDNVAPIAASFTMPLGSGLSGTLAVENPFQRATSVKDGDLGAQRIPDVVGSVQWINGPATVKVSAASHQVVGEASGDTKQGYAVQTGIKYTVSPETSLWLQGTYARGAMSYLGYGIVGSTDDGNDPAETYKVASTSISSDASDALELSYGWSALAALNQKLGSGNLAIIGTYGEQTNNRNYTGLVGDKSVEGTVTQVEVNYTFKPYAGVNFQPAFAYQKWDLQSAYTGSDLVANTDRYAVRLRAWREF